MNKSKASLFLMELIIAILFFSVSAVVCVQLFVKAHLTNQETTSLAGSNIVLQNLAEGFLGCDGDISEFAALYDGAHYDEELSTLEVYYDAEWNACDKQQAVYTASTYCHEEDGLDVATITILDNDANTLSFQNIKHYRQLEAEVIQ